jgi:hypothetical protein
MTNDGPVDNLKLSSILRSMTQLVGQRTRQLRGVAFNSITGHKPSHSHMIRGAVWSNVNLAGHKIHRTLTLTLTP